MVYVILAVAAVGIASIAIYVVSHQIIEDRQRPGGSKSVTWNCKTCGNAITLHPKACSPLSREDAALTIQQRPRAYGRKMGTLQCTRCRTTHTFLIDTTPPAWIISDEKHATGTGQICTQCRDPLVSPPWPPRTRDGAIHLVPDAPPKAGVVCARCGAICCIECVRSASQGRSTDESFLCPRCYRKPVNRFHHF